MGQTNDQLKDEITDLGASDLETRFDTNFREWEATCHHEHAATGTLKGRGVTEKAALSNLLTAVHTAGSGGK